MSKLSRVTTMVAAGVTATLFPIMLAFTLGYTRGRGSNFGDGVDTGMVLVGELGGLLLLVVMSIVSGVLVAKVNSLAGTALALVMPLLVVLFTSTPVDPGRVCILFVSSLTMTFLLSVAFGGTKQKVVKVERKNVASKPESTVNPALAAFGKKSD